LDVDSNGHPIWTQDSSYNIGSSTDWSIFFDVQTYFNWVIGTEQMVEAYCNDTISDNPIDCNEWHQKDRISNEYSVKNTLSIKGGLCPAGDDSKNTTNYCIKSKNDALNGYTGTYKQVIAGIPEWFYTKNSGDVAVLYWTEWNVLNDGKYYGWKIKAGFNDEAVCRFADYDVSINNPSIRFFPNLCNEWLDKTQSVDPSFDIDSNICEASDLLIDSDATKICIEYESDDIDTAYSAWSGVYELFAGAQTVNNHRVWTFIFGDNIYHIIYYEIGDGWIITKDVGYNMDDEVISDQDIIAICNDDEGLMDNPTLCGKGWKIMDAANNDTEIIIYIITDNEQCNAPIIQTTLNPETTKEIIEDKNKKEEGFGVAEYVGFGSALLVFPICILCWFCYQRQKNKEKNNDNDHGISLQPYVPTGMAYDSYKKKEDRKMSYEVKKKQKEKTLKVAAPVSVMSATGADDGDDGQGSGRTDTLDSTNALINVFDDDMAPDPQIIDDDDKDNPFLIDGYIRTGQTIDETNMQQTKVDIMSAFDE